MVFSEVIATAAAAIGLIDTVVKIRNGHQQLPRDEDFWLLIEEVRVTELKRIDQADDALDQLQTTSEALTRRYPGRPLRDIINETPWWRFFEQYRLREIQRTFDTLSQSTVNAIDNISALARCRNQPPLNAIMRQAVANGASHKDELCQRIHSAEPVEDQIAILREELRNQRAALER